MAQRESKLSRKIMDALKDDWAGEIFVFKVWGNEMMMAGLPDIVGCVKGMFFAIETKLPEKRSNVSPQQEYVHGLIDQAGGRVAVCVTPQEACRQVRQWVTDYTRKKGGKM